MILLITYLRYIKFKLVTLSFVCQYGPLWGLQDIKVARGNVPVNLNVKD